MVKIDRTYTDGGADRRAILCDAADPTRKAHRLLLMYFTNVVLDYLKTGRSRSGITITETTTAPATALVADEWFIDGPVFYNQQHLLLFDGKTVIEFGKKVAPDGKIHWDELTARTWPQWWKSLDAEWHLDEVFSSD